MRTPSRRAILGLCGAGGLGLLGLRCFGPRLLRAGPVRAVAELSDTAQRLVAAAFAGVRAERLLDLHVHVLGLGHGGSGCWIHPRLRSHLHPIDRLRYEVFLAASGIDDDGRADGAYVERLLALQRAANPLGRLLLLAFDAFVGEDGREDRGSTMLVVPDEYVCALARAHPEFLACASVHPYRPDALERLQRAAENGAVAVKWLPNAMGIDPAAPRCLPFYEKLVALGLPLLVHTGEELAVWVEGTQELGNPLRLRAALERGVTVVALHCASLGSARDLDADGERRPCLELFLRLLAERTPGRLHGELSALTLINRDPALLRELLARDDLHARLLNGSDYPLVAIDPLVGLSRLARHGLLDPRERAPLREIFAANPLLFDLVLKRRLRIETPAGTRRFPAEAFESARLFDKL